MIVKNEAKRMVILGELKLLPGCNDIDSDVWKKYEKEEIYDIAAIMKQSALSIISDKKDNKKVYEFADFSYAIKEQVLHNMYDLKMLHNYRRKEMDVSIKTLIEDRIKQLENDFGKEKTRQFGTPANHV